MDGIGGQLEVESRHQEGTHESIRHITCSGDVLKEILSELQPEDEREITLTRCGRIYAGKKYIAALKPSDRERTEEPKKKAIIKTYFNAEVLFSSEAAPCIFLPEFTSIGVEETFRALKPLIIRRLEAVFRYVEGAKIAGDRRKDPLTLQARIPILKIQALVKRNTQCLRINPVTGEIFHAGKKVARLALGEDDCIGVAYSPYFGVYVPRFDPRFIPHGEIQRILAEASCDILEAMQN